GWAIIDWMSRYLRAPSDSSLPCLPTHEPARFMVWWYAVAERGKYALRDGVLRRVKGRGKDPLVAAIALVELVGPVEFSHFDEDGGPAGKRRPAAWIQLAAVSEEQAHNTIKMFRPLISDKLREYYKLDVKKTMIDEPEGGAIESVTSNPDALEGNRPTLVILNEIQWWREANQGTEMYQKIVGNQVKRASAGARYLA